MAKSKSDKVLNLNPLQFDDHFFSNWKPPNYSFYNRFHIERIENYREHLNLPIPPHRRSVHFFMFLKTGKAVRSKGLSNYEINAGQFFFLPAEQITTLEFMSDDATGFYCHFQPEIFLQNFLRADIDKDFPFFQLTSEPTIEISEQQRICQLLEILENENLLSKDNRFDLISVYLIALFSEINHSILAPKKEFRNATAFLTQRYKNALSAYIYQKKSVSEFADYLGVSPNHLHKCVKSTTGKTAHELLNEMRILEAKVLLKQTDLNIGEIAFKIGQFESSDFGRFFKKNTNLTPNQYRNSEY